jgi:hypothetical protein
MHSRFKRNLDVLEGGQRAPIIAEDPNRLNVKLAEATRVRD